MAGMAGCIGGNSGSSGGNGNGTGGGGPDQIVVGLWGGSWQETMIDAVVNPYEQETGISVDFIIGQDPERLSRIVAQRENPPTDVSQQAGYGLVRGENENLWYELNSDLVPRISEVPDRFKSDYWTLQIYAASALVYNTETFDSPPESWDAYLDPQYKGRVGLYTEDPTHDLLAFALHQTNGNDPTAIDKAFEMYERVVAEMDPVFITSSDEYGNRWTNGELDIGRYWSARAASWRSNGAPTSFSIPNSGALTTTFGNAIPANIPEERLNAAGKFINQTLTESALGLARSSESVN